MQRVGLHVQREREHRLGRHDRVLCLGRSTGFPAGTAVTQAATFPAAGTYPVTLTVTDDEGETDEVTTMSPSPTHRRRASPTAARPRPTPTRPRSPSRRRRARRPATSCCCSSPAPRAPLRRRLRRVDLGGEPADGTDMRTTLYRRVGTTGGLGSVSVDGRSTKTNLTVLAYSGAAAAPVGLRVRCQDHGGVHLATPRRRAVDQPGSVVVSFWALRGSAAPLGRRPRARSSGRTAPAAGGGHGLGLGRRPGRCRGRHRARHVPRRPRSARPRPPPGRSCWRRPEPPRAQTRREQSVAERHAACDVA